MSDEASTPAPFRSAVALQGALHSGEVTAVEAARFYLDRIAARDDLGAFVTVTEEAALAEAAQADARLAAHRADPQTYPLPALNGMPLAHKDIVEYEGAKTTYGTAAMPHTVATVDHPVVATMRAAGSVSLGKTQVPELGLNCYSENLIAPPARNPFDLARTPGGSSGGSAAAVAAGLLPVAPGNDGGGSIRIPALATGLIGLKPGLGTLAGDVVDGYENNFGAPKLVVHGPLAHTAEDAALLMDVLAGTGNLYAEAVHRAEEVKGLTIAANTATPFEAAFDTPLSSEAQRAYELAAERLAALGHAVEEADFTYDPEYNDFFTDGWTSGLTQLPINDGAAERLMALASDYRRKAFSRTQAQHVESARRLKNFAAEVRAMWGQTDLVLTPGLAFEPPRIGHFTDLSPDEDYREQCRFTPYTSMVNVSGLPAIAVPILTTENGLPMGAHLIGRPGSEPQLLAIAKQLAAL